jgi:hypothetical protein
MNTPLSVVETLPDNQLKISSEAPLNSTTGSTAFMEAEASRSCNGKYEILSKNLIKADSENNSERVELIVQCYSVIASNTRGGEGADEVITIVVKGNDTVRLAQTRLNEFGYDAGRADGFLGETTKHAIELFQSDSNLNVTGRLDQRTQRALHIL